MSQVLRALGHHHLHLWAQINLCLHNRQKNKESKMWTNTSEFELSNQEASLRHTAEFCPPWHCHSLCTMERGQLNDLVRCSCSTSNWKNVPEFSVTYWYSGLTGFLIMGQSGLPAVFHSRRAKRHHLSQAAFSAWLSPEIWKGISFCKTSGEQRWGHRLCHS